MKKRNPIVVLMLNIITGGIYGLYWLWSTKKAINSRTTNKIPTMWLLFAPALIMLAALLLLAIFSNGSTIASVGVALVYVICFVIILPVTFYWYLKYSKAANEYTGGHLNTAVAFILLWFLQSIGIAVAQDAYNDVIEAEAAGGVPTPQPMVDPTIAVNDPTPTPMPAQPIVSPVAATSPVSAPEVSAPTVPQVDAAPQASVAVVTPEAPVVLPQPGDPITPQAPAMPAPAPEAPTAQNPAQPGAPQPPIA